jgi:hypothetical protein
VKADHHLPLSLILPEIPEDLLSYLSQNPTNPTTAPVFSITKALLGVGLCV